jgi:hypothetical protein
MKQQFVERNIIVLRRMITMRVQDLLLVRLLLLGSLLSGLRHFTTGLVGLLNGFDDTDGDGLSHVTDGETTKRWVLRVGLNTHGLGWDELSNAGITRLDKLGVGLHDLTSSTIDLLDQLGELASNVGSVAIEHWGVTSTDLTRVVKNDDLGIKGGSLLGGIVLGVGSDVSTTDILDGNVLNVETDIVTGVALLELLVMHLDGLDFSGHVGRSKGNDHAGLDDTSLDTTDGHSPNTTDLVDILERETEGLVGGTGGGLDGVDGVEEGLTLDDTTLGLLGPTLVPWHVGRLLQHVVSVPSRDGDEGNGLGVVSDLFDETRSLLDDFVETVLAPLGGVHLVDGHDELPDTEGEGEQGMLTGLTVLRDTGLELTSSTGDDEDGAIGLGGTSDHVLDKVTVTWGIDDSNHELGGLELPEGDIDGDTTLTLGLELVEHPGILEGTLSELSSFLLELLDGTLIDTTALVDQVTSSGGFSGIDVSDDDDVNVSLFLSHVRLRSKNTKKDEWDGCGRGER